MTEINSSITTSPLQDSNLLTDHSTRRQLSSTSTSNSNNNETDDLIHHFRLEREKRKHKSFWFVVRVAWGLMLLGVVGFCADASLFYTLPEYPSLASNIMSSMFMLVVGSGYLLFSTVPLDLLDIDQAVQGKYWMRTMIFAVGFTMSVVSMVVPPFAHSACVLFSLTCLYPDNDKSYYWNRMTFKICIWFFLYSGCIAVMYCYFTYMSSFDSDVSNQGVFITVDFPMGKPFYNMYIFLSIYYVIGTILFIRIWYKRRSLYYSSNFEKGARPTMCVYLCMYCWNAIFGLGLIINGIWLYVHAITGKADEYDIVTFGSNCIGVGVALLIPPVVVIILSRETIFKVMVKRFDNDSNNLHRDGAFIAGLLDRVDIVVGQNWYIHRDVPDDSYDEFDFNKYWKKGRVMSFSDDNKRMAVSDEGAEGGVVWVELGTTVDSDELLALARKNLRCVDFETIISMKLLSNGSVRDANVKSYYELSRPVSPGEKIDFFISHSWHDPSDIKVEQLQRSGELFKQKYGRYPTFWLDKVCIDQNNIGSGLKVLPINVMACRRMMVLCGTTYSRRLWCVWELCTLFSFVEIESAFDKVSVVPLDKQDTETSVMEELIDFDVKTARCYDPNEEIKLNKVIDAVGVDKFHDKIRSLARFYVESKGRVRGMSAYSSQQSPV